MALLAVNDLSVEFVTSAGRLRAVDGVSFALNEGDVLGVVGESGSGKTVACRSILRLLPSERARIAGGEALFEGRDLLRENEARLRRLRGRRLAMIFQNPSTHLDPLMTVGRQVAEPLIYHEGLPSREARARAIELLRLVGIPDPAHNAGSYPHQLSGGMRQRAMIAAAIACQPRLLIADEPTTALDVTVQVQILRLLLELRDRSGLAIILISHDLGVIASTCDRVAVMYAGRIMEQATKAELLRQPRHPYTAGLVASRPSDGVRGRTLRSIEGQLPALSALPPGCRFHPRCPHAREVCRSGDLQPVLVDATHATACIRWREVTGAA
jgi:peptide/nickel transport system ATP-binding protein